MVRGRHVEERVVAIAGTSAIETVEAHIEARGIVDRVEALGAVFSVHRLSWPRRVELYGMLVLPRLGM